MTRSLKAAIACRLGLNAEDGAYIVPLNFAYVPGEAREILFPQRKRGKKGRHDRAGQRRPGFELDGAHRLGEAETGCRHTFFYQSVIGTGTVRPVETLEEKKRALSAIMAHYRKDCAFSFTDEQADAVAVFCLTAETMSCKQHS